MKSRSGKQNGILARFSCSYFLLLAIPLIMCVITYHHTMDILQQQAARENTRRMEQLAEQLEKSMTEADRFVQSLEKISEVSDFMNSRNRTQARVITEMNEAVRALPEFRDSNGLFSRYSIFSAAGMALEPDKGYLSPEKYYNDFFRYDEMSYQQWREMLLSMRISSSVLLPARSAVINTRADPVAGRALLYIRPFPLAARQQGYVVFYLQEEALLESFQGLVPEPSTEYALLRTDGTFLAGTAQLNENEAAGMAGTARSGSQRLNLSGENSVVTYCRSWDGNWLLLSATPQAAFASQAMQVIYPMLLSLFAFLLLGVVLTVIVWRGNRKPLKATMDKLQLGRKDGLWQIDQAVLQLINTNHQLQRNLEEQRMALRSALFNRVYNGEITEPREMIPLLKKLGVPLKEGYYYRGVVLKFSLGADTPAQNDINDYLTALLSALFSPANDCLFFLSPADPGTLLLLHACQENDAQGRLVTQDLRRVYAMLREEYQLEASFYVGYPVSAIPCIAYSFNACRRLKMDAAADMEWLHIANRSVINGYSYTAADEQQLISHLRAGHYPEVRETLEKILEKNMRNHLSALQIQMLGYRMLDTLLQLNLPVSLEVEILQPLQQFNLPAFFKQLSLLYQSLCEQAEATRQQKANQLATDVIAYIDAHYDQYEMSLSALSVRFGVTEKYLSAFIKKKLGVNFLTYLEGLRISRADELLVESNLTIEQIARQVGYANGKAFRRVYQRVTGQSPSLRRASGMDVLPSGVPSDGLVPEPTSCFCSPLRTP